MNAKAIPAFWFTVRFAFLLAQQTAFRILQFLQFEGNSGLAAPGWFSILVVVVVVVGRAGANLPLSRVVLGCLSSCLLISCHALDVFR